MLLLLPLIGSVFLSRFSFNFHERKLALPLLIIAASVAGLALFGKLRIHLPRAILFTLTMAAMVTSTVLGGAGRVSVMSFLLLAVIYLGYIFVVECSAATYAWIIGAFRAICLVTACAGIAQFFAQLVIPGPTLFTYRGYIPDQFLALEYHYVDPIDLWAGANKSNGFFLPEPSIFSQLMGLAAVVELLFFRPSWRLAVIGFALFVAFSGTGVLLCLVFLPVLLLRRGDPSLLLLAICALLLLLLFINSPYLEPFVGRLGEFDSTRSSAFARFLSPFYLFDDFLLPNLRNALFGMGPGAIDVFFNNYYIDVHDPTWGKVFFEYGLVGTLPFAVFVLCSFFGDAPEKWLSSALFFNWLLLGGYLLSAPVAGLVLALAVWHRAPRPPAAPPPDPRLMFRYRPEGAP